MSELTLPGMRSLPPVGDELGRRYTPDPLAYACLSRLQRHMGEVDILVDPAVGGGAFPRGARRLWPRAKIIGVDLDPKADGLKLCDHAYVGDWTTLAAEIIAKFQPDLIATNPPFDDPRGGAPTRAQDFTRAALQGPGHHRVSFILPLACLGTKGWTRLICEDALWHLTPIVGRPWPDHVREVALYTWRTRSWAISHAENGLLLDAIEEW